MTEPRVGEMRYLLQVLAATAAIDDIGGTQLSWQQVGEVWAAVYCVDSKEIDKSDRIIVEKSYDVWVRHNNWLGSQMRFLWCGKVMEITGIIEVGIPCRWLRCRAREGVA